MTLLSLQFKEYLLSKNLWRAILAEFIGTALVVFLSCGTMVVTSKPGVAPSDGINIIVTAWTTGFAIGTADFIFEPSSGANFNPAFTFGLFCIGRTTLVRCFMYMIAQFFGGIIGAGALYFVCPFDLRANLGSSVLWSNVTPGHGFLIETVSTFLVFFFILASDELREIKAPVSHQSAIRVSIAFMALTLAFFPYSMVSMNPARSFGPALLSWTWKNHWIYWLGPFIGAPAACLFFGIIWARRPHHHFFRHASGVVRKFYGEYSDQEWGMEERNNRLDVEDQPMEYEKEIEESSQ